MRSRAANLARRGKRWLSWKVKSIKKGTDSLRFIGSEPLMLDSKNTQRDIGGSGKDQYLELHWLYVVDIHSIR